MTEFLRALPDDRVQDTTRRFFPISGHWTYTRTVHLKGGGVFVNRWTLPAAETSLLFGFGERPPVNPVRESFDLNPERQKPGLLLDVIMRSGDEWRLVGGNRFVPPFLTASSAIFVEWRKEGDTWVINAFGDEWFDGDHLPDWY